MGIKFSKTLDLLTEDDLDSVLAEGPVDARPRRHCHFLLVDAVDPRVIIGFYERGQNGIVLQVTRCSTVDLTLLSGVGIRFEPLVSSLTWNEDTPNDERGVEGYVQLQPKETGFHFALTYEGEVLRAAVVRLADNINRTSRAPRTTPRVLDAQHENENEGE
jgi:hypothetical protein